MLNNEKIGIITGYMIKANFQPLNRFMTILNELKIYSSLILLSKTNLEFKPTPYNTKIYRINPHWDGYVYITAISYIISQLKMIYYFLRMFNINLWIIYMGELSFIPIIISKLTGKKILLLMGGNFQEEKKLSNYPFFIQIITNLIWKLDLKLADDIIVFSDNLINFWQLEGYKNKISVIHRHFVDLDKFYIKHAVNERENIVGFIGVLNYRKGCMNFLNAVSLLKGYNFKFFIAGEGELREEMENFISKNSLDIDFLDWIPNNELPDYLNRLKLFILPSHNEGLPNIIMEAMACGTPVLATPVGAIPDIIKDGKNGFIMENNSPDLIKKKIIEIIQRDDLQKISDNSRNLAENEFYYRNVIKNWEKFFMNYS